jgi:hypothetical protein
LTLRFMNGGGFGAVWSWLKYHAEWKNVRQPQGSALSETALVSIITSLLAYVSRIVQGYGLISGKDCCIYG